MAFGQPNYPYFSNTGFQAPAYPQPIPAYQPRQEQPAPFQQPGTLLARYVTGREEAVAAQIIPGDPFIFADFQHGRMYVKQINPQTMAADFVEFVRTQPAQQPQEQPVQPQAQFATIADIEALRGELEALRTSMTPKQTNRKAVAADD